MDILVLDQTFTSIKPIDTYYSLIWTVRYAKGGDFELYIPFAEDVFTYLKEGNYLSLHGSDRIMFIEDMELSTNPEDGTFLTVSGRSLESMLTRRIVWDETVLSGSLQSGILKLLNENVIAPQDSARRIDNFIFEPTTDPYILAQTIEAEFWGEELYEVITELCSSKQIGFKVTLSDDDKFIFKLYRGMDHSYNQEINPYVVFSPEFENLKNSSYLMSSKMQKNVTLIKGEESGWAHRMETLGTGSGIARREIFTDASGVKSETEEGYIPDNIYKERLKQKGKEVLDENKFVNVFESGADVNKTFQYDKDFTLGDVVQLQNEQGFEEVTRVTEIIFAQDMEGYNVYPTFEVDDKE